MAMGVVGFGSERDVRHAVLDALRSGSPGADHPLHVIECGSQIVLYLPRPIRQPRFGGWGAAGPDYRYRRIAAPRRVPRLAVACRYGRNVSKIHRRLPPGSGLVASSALSYMTTVVTVFTGSPPCGKSSFGTPRRASRPS
jgi:hypothetical protein